MPKYTINGALRSFASKSCELRTRWQNLEYKIEMTEMVHESWQNPEVIAKASANNRRHWTPEKRERYARRLFGVAKYKIDNGIRTDGEAAIEAALVALGVPYEFEYNIGRYWVDFAIPSKSLALECDGAWHLAAKARDAKRDAYLASLGWRVIRIPRDAALRNAPALLRELLT